MKKNTLKIILLIFCVLIICLIAINIITIDKPPDNTEDYLTIRESLIPLFTIGNLNNEQFPFNKLNQNAREYVRFYLEEDTSSQSHVYGAIWLLGFIGDENDILFMEEYIDKTILSSKDLDKSINHLHDLSWVTGCFTGMMIKRNIKGADLLVKKYSQDSSWTSPDYKGSSVNLSTARSLYGPFLMSAYQYSKSDYIYSLLQKHEFTDSVKNVEVDKYTELMKPRTLPQDKIDENIKKLLDEYGQWIDMLLKKQTFAEWRKEQEEQKAVSNIGTN